MWTRSGRFLQVYEYFSKFRTRHLIRNDPKVSWKLSMYFSRVESHEMKAPFFFASLMKWRICNINIWLMICPIKFGKDQILWSFFFSFNMKTFFQSFLAWGKFTKQNHSSREFGEDDVLKFYSYVSKFDVFWSIFLFVPLSFLSSSFLKPKCHSKDRKRTFFKMFWEPNLMNMTSSWLSNQIFLTWNALKTNVWEMVRPPQNILKKVRCLSFEWHFGLRKAGDKTAKEQKEIYFPFWHETKRNLK